MARRFDLVVIGGGSGGIATARRAAGHGAKVALIERDRIGGTCVNRGCVPKKVMWHAASVAETIEDARDYGFDVEAKGFDWARLRAAREAYLERLNGIYHRGLDASGVTEIAGTARFVDAHTVEVNGERLEGNHVLIATGSRPEIPDVAGAELGITSDGFFRTGDLAEVSDDGYYTLLGRKSDLIISGGFNIYPREIEELLAEQSGVAEAAVVGVQDSVRGEVPVAYVAGDFDAAELEKACRAQLASFKVPRRFVKVDAIPRTALGKVQKHLLPR